MDFSFLSRYLPPAAQDDASSFFLTLTYAQSVDGKIAARKGVQTAISSAETKAMTQFLRSCHDAILVGIGTVLCDDPGLNCKLGLAQSPTPVVLDLNGDWEFAGSKMDALAQARQGKPPVVVVARGGAAPDSGTRHTDGTRRISGTRRRDYSYLERCGGHVVEVEEPFSWRELGAHLQGLGLRSVMVEGGAGTIAHLLKQHSEAAARAEPPLINSLVITIAPMYLGSGGVGIDTLGLPLANVAWWTGTTDSVLAATL